VVVALRPLANPLPLGFLALAIATLLVSGLQLGWLDAAEGRSIALILLAFVVPAQVLAAILGFLARDVVAGTAMAILAGSWLAIALVTLDAPLGATSDSLGLFLIAAGVTIWVPGSAAAATKLVPALILTIAGLRFALTGVYQLTAAPGWEQIAGLVGVLLFVLGVYAGLAMMFEDADREALPLGRRAEGKGAIGAEPEPARVVHEAGVREQL
jgi:uncharacterized protein